MPFFSIPATLSGAPYVERTHPMLIPLAAALGLSEAQVDQAFVEAASI